MQSNPQATPVAIDPDHLSSLFIVDAVLRRLSECLSLQASPMPGYAAPAIPRAVLHLIVEEKLIAELDAARSSRRPFIDSQQVISRILTALGPLGNFHRQFGERFPDLKPNQTLGMQLYALVASDAETWIYSPTQHAGHVHPHATYFKPGA